MRTASLRHWAGASMALALVFGVLAAILAAPPAHARIMSAAFSFPALSAGEKRSATATVNLPRTAELVAVEITEDTTAPGDFHWSAQLCPPAGACLPATTASEGAEVLAGEHTLAVAVELDPDAAALASSTLTGRLVFTDHADDEGLPPTGALAWSLVALAGLLLVCGLALVDASRRREVARA